MEANTKLIGTGIGGAAISMLCCLTPALVVIMGALGFAAYVAKADYVLIPAFVIFVGLALFGFIQIQRACSRCEPPQAAQP